MAEQPGAGRLDPDTLAAYVDGLLPPEERAKVEAEIATDPESYEWLVNSINAVNDDSIVAAGDEPVRRSSSDRGLMTTPAPSPAPMPARGTTPRPAPGPHGGSDVPGKVLPFYRRRAVMAGAGAMVAAAASLLLVVQLQPEWWQRWRGPQVDPRFAKLVEAVGEERYIEARLTGGFKYGPLRQVMRGPSDLSNQNLQLLASAGELQKAAEQDPSAENLHAWGVALLMLGQLDAAVERLGAAAELAGASAYYSDLSAALLTRGRSSGSRDDFIAALERAQSASVHEPAVEGEHNRALALESLARWTEAAQAWEGVARLDHHSAWSDEARRRAAAARDHARAR